MVTDDTQMTLFTAEGLIRASVRCRPAAAYELGRDVAAITHGMEFGGEDQRPGDWWQRYPGW